MFRRSMVCVVLAGLAAAPVAGAIWGGEDAEVGAYPFMVHVFHKGDATDSQGYDGFICGGFLAAPTIVVTAGHCLESVADRLPLVGPVLGGGPFERPQALVGATDRSAGGEVIDIVALHQHPQWMIGPGFGVNDIGVFELAEPSTMTPVRLAQPGDEVLYPAGTMATTIGWGWMEGYEELPDRLQEVHVPVHDDWDCKTRLTYLVLFWPETELCAGAPGKDSCGGDSGGPLFIEHEGAPLVIGIVSYGSQTGDCGDPEHPGVYVEVAAYADYLAQFV